MAGGGRQVAGGEAAGMAAEVSGDQRDADVRCRMLSEKAGSGVAFFRKFSIDLSRAAFWGKHCNAASKRGREERIGRGTRHAMSGREAHANYMSL